MSVAHRTIFPKDDYTRIARFFAPLREGLVYADPSGWLDTVCNVADSITQPHITANGLARYCLDHGESLGAPKQIIANALSAWEGREIPRSEFTLFHSVSSATLGVLMFLKERGVNTLIMETPAYIVTIEQAFTLGFKVVLLPSYEEDNFSINWPKALGRRPTQSALWLTQPRMSLGYNQAPEEILRLSEELSPGEFMIIDEATEQIYPSHLREIAFAPQSHKVIRIRGLLKAVGLNGLRLAFVLHGATLRPSFEAVQETVGSSLDIFSLQSAVSIAAAEGRLRQVLNAANSQVVELRERAEALSYGTGVRVSHLVNGYIGCASVDFRGMSGNYAEKRKRLLKFCRTRKMPVLLGRNMRFAFDCNREHIRLNYFLQSHHITRAVKVLADFVEES
jgi:histidinol-phosphate/aromatic aminotransferase/cobyric acid decarboxylase-like protein